MLAEGRRAAPIKDPALDANTTGDQGMKGLMESARSRKLRDISKMRVLILGGTRFIGRQIVESLLSAGHLVSILTRGKSLDELPVQVERLRGDRDEGVVGLKTLTGRSWDVCVDVSGYTPQQVRPSADMLSATVKRYVFVSAVSVYGDPQDRPVLETHPRLPAASENLTEIDADTYCLLKVACEDIVQQNLRTTTVRSFDPKSS